MKKYTELLRRLVDIMSVSGFEKEAAPEVCDILSGFDFDSIKCDRIGNIILRKSAAKGAPAIVLDAHLDEIGFRVREIHEGGFVSVVPVGGIDTVILPAAEVTLHGKEKLHGVFTVPVCDGDPKLDNMYVDTGYTAEKLREILSVGDAVSFNAPVVQMQNDLLAGHAFDDKALASALVCAVADTPREELAFDVYVTISSREEVGGGGAACAALDVSPVGAVVTDVNFATSPGVRADESGKLGAGPMVSLSAVTDMILTKQILSLADANGIHISTVVESSNTGTNATFVYISGGGIPCAVVSLPLAGMHTASECISLRDAENFMALMRRVITSEDISRELKAREEDFNV